jgi:hypothetical protein
MLYIKTKFPNSPIVLFGDWNLRLGHLTRDHHCNNTHLNAFTSFLESNQFHLIPSCPNADPYTFSTLSHDATRKRVSAGDFWITSDPTLHPPSLFAPQVQSTIHHELDANSPHKLVSTTWHPALLSNATFSWGTSPNLKSPLKSEHHILAHTLLFQLPQAINNRRYIQNYLDQIPRQPPPKSKAPTSIIKKINHITHLLLLFLTEPNQPLKVTLQAHRPSPNNRTHGTSRPNATHNPSPTPTTPFLATNRERNPTLKKANELIRERSAILSQLTSYSYNLLPPQRVHELQCSVASLNKKISRLQSLYAHHELQNKISDLCLKFSSANKKEFFAHFSSLLNANTQCFPTQITSNSGKPLTTPHEILNATVSHFLSVSNLTDMDGRKHLRCIPPEHATAKRDLAQAASALVASHCDLSVTFPHLRSYHPFTLQELQKAIASLRKKKGKSRGPTPITYEHFLAAPPPIRKILLFNSAFQPIL